MAFTPQESTAGNPAAPNADGAGPDTQDEFEAAFKEIVEESKEKPAEADTPATTPDPASAAPADATTPTQPAEGQPPQAADTSTTPAAAPAAQGFDWTKAPPEAKAAHDAAIAAQTADKTKLEQQNTRMRGQISVYERNRRTTQAANPAAGDRTQPPPLDKKVVAETNARIKTDYPELAPVVEQNERLTETVESLSADRAANEAAQRQTEYDLRYQELLGMHSDYETIVRTPDGHINPNFLNYVRSQPEWFQELVNRNGENLEDLKAADFVMRSYKSAQGTASSSSSQPQAQGEPAPNNPMAARREKQLEGSASVRSRGGAAGSGPPDDFEAAFSYYASQKPRKG